MSTSWPVHDATRSRRSRRPGCRSSRCPRGLRSRTPLRAPVEVAAEPGTVQHDPRSGHGPMQRLLGFGQHRAVAGPCRSIASSASRMLRSGSTSRFATDAAASSRAIAVRSCCPGLPLLVRREDRQAPATSAATVNTATTARSRRTDRRSSSRSCAWRSARRPPAGRVRRATRRGTSALLGCHGEPDPRPTPRPARGATPAAGTTGPGRPRPSPAPRRPADARSAGPRAPRRSIGGAEATRVSMASCASSIVGAPGRGVTVERELARGAEGVDGPSTSPAGRGPATRAPRCAPGAGCPPCPRRARPGAGTAAARPPCPPSSSSS